MFRILALIAVASLVFACGTDGETDPIAADEFVIPLSKHSLDGELSATLVEATPSPPARGSNRWTLEVSDADGNPVEGLDLKAVLFMPEHRHGSSPTQITETDVPGEYEVSRMNFIMGGVWEVRLIDEGQVAARDVLFYVRVPD